MAAMAAALLAAGACHHSRMVLGMDDPCPLCSYDMGAQPVLSATSSAVPFEWTALTLLPQGVHFRVWISDRWHRRHTARLRFPEKSQSPKIPPSLCQRRRNPLFRLCASFIYPPRDAGCGALRGFATRPWACMPQMQYCDRGSAPHGVFARRMRRQTRTTVFPALLTFPTAGCSAAFGGGGAGRPFEVESWRSRAGLRHAARVAPDRPGDQRVVPLRWLQHLLDGAGRERRRRCAPDALQDHRFVGHP